MRNAVSLFIVMHRKFVFFSFPRFFRRIRGRKGRSVSLNFKVASLGRGKGKKKFPRRRGREKEGCEKGTCASGALCVVQN